MWATKSTITSSSSSSGIWAWPMRSRTSGTMLAQAVGDQLDVVHAVVDEVNLPAAGQLALDRVANQLVVPAGDLRFDGQAILGRRFEVRNVAQADERHVQRPRNRRGRERQHIDRRPQRLQPLLHIDAEPLLLVDDHQAQVVELDVLRGQPMRADDDVDLARLEPGERCRALPRACRSG